MSCHSVAVVPTLVQTKHKGINIHKGNNTKKTVKTIQNTVNTSTQITKTPTHTHTHTHTHTLITKPTHTHAHTLQNKLNQPQYKLKQTQYKTYSNEIVTI